MLTTQVLDHQPADPAAFLLSLLERLRDAEASFEACLQSLNALSLICGSSAADSEEVQQMPESPSPKAHSKNVSSMREPGLGH